MDIFFIQYLMDFIVNFKIFNLISYILFLNTFLHKNFGYYRVQILVLLVKKPKNINPRRKYFSSTCQWCVGHLYLQSFRFIVLHLPITFHLKIIFANYLDTSCVSTSPNEIFTGNSTTRFLILLCITYLRPAGI